MKLLHAAFATLVLGPLQLVGASEDASPTGDRWLDLSGLSASQSSTGYGGSASRAIDGNTDGQWNGHSCTHTHGHVGYNQWWQVDLAGVHNIEKVKVYNRMDCCSQRLNPFDIYVDDVPCAEDVEILGAEKEVACHATGQVVKIALKNDNFLTLCEVKIALADAEPPVESMPTDEQTALALGKAQGLSSVIATGHRDGQAFRPSRETSSALAAPAFAAVPAAMVVASLVVLGRYRHAAPRAELLLPGDVVDETAAESSTTAALEVVSGDI